MLMHLEKSRLCALALMSIVAAYMKFRIFAYYLFIEMQKKFEHWFNKVLSHRRKKTITLSILRPV